MTEPSTTRSRILRRLAGTASVCTALAVLAAPALTASSSTAVELGFPYVHDFTSPAGGELHGDASITGGRLRLTEDVQRQADAWSTNDTFPSDTGLEIEFTYTMHTDEDDPGADGLLLFLADGAAPQGVGSFGAGLGYTCRVEATEGGSTTLPCDLPGVPGGFAAVALDHYGNFSAPIGGSGPGARPQHVVIRGSGNGTTGYRHIAAAPAPGGVLASGDDPRRVRITLLPSDDGELTMTVRLQDGAAMHTVLADVPLHGDGQASLPPTLRLGFSAATGSHVNVHEVEEFRVWKPADLAVEQDLPAQLAPGAAVEYTATARNIGVNTSAPSAFAVDVPDELQDVTWRCAGADGAACGTESGTGDVGTDLDLPRGSAAAVTISATVAEQAAGTLESTATIAAAPSVSDVDESDNTSRATATVDDVAPVAHVETDKRVAPADGVEPGDEVEYTVTARNRGPAVAEDVGAVDVLPGPLRFTGSPDDCTAEGQTVTCHSGRSLAAGETTAFRIRAELDPDYRGDGSDIPNVATATSPTDPDGGDESEEVVIGVVDPDGPEPSVSPHPSVSPEPTGTPADGDGRPGTDRSPVAAPDGSGARRGGPTALAYTGATDLAVVAALAGVVLAAGGACWWLARRRHRLVTDATDRVPAPGVGSGSDVDPV
ncbi:hypothetical protein [Curtobacterium sp. NPDC089689]|uniref:hypothetical protein n=1 Tax=Curtobacterium sp. NPDC089689 TaxID=3363968 RepID=UPI0038068C6F